MDEPIRDPVAALDQALAEMQPVSKLLFAHFMALNNAGFNERQALRLTEVLASEWWRSQLGRADAPQAD